MKKLIVSVSFGTQALFRWKGKSCPDSEDSLCCLGHGDILVMDGQCQDEFLHCTDPGSEQERTGITFRWIRQHIASCPFPRTGVVCCLPNVCTGFIRLFHGGGGDERVLGDSGCSQGFGAYGRCWLCWLTPSCPQDLGYAGVPIAGHALCAELGALSSWSSGVHWFLRKCVWKIRKSSLYYVGVMLYMLASMRSPSLHGYHACMVFWFDGALQGNHRQNICKNCFFPSSGFSG